MLKNCPVFIGGFAQVGSHLDRPVQSVQVVMHMAQVQEQAEIWGRFGQESRSFGQTGATGERYAKRAKRHKHCLFRILLIWRVGT